MSNGGRWCCYNLRVKYLNMTTIHKTLKTLTYRNIVCRLSGGKLTKGKYLIGAMYSDQNTKPAFNLYKKITRTDLYGAGYWDNLYKNPEDCGK
jgi:hypothetical protein